MSWAQATSVDDHRPLGGGTNAGRELERQRDSRVCPARLRGFCGPVRRRYCRRPGGPRAPRGYPTGRPSPVGLAHGVRGRRAPGSGVGLYSKLQPVRVDTSLGVPRFDREGRFMAGHFQTARGRFVVVNSYFPKGSGPDRDNSRVGYKLDFSRTVFARAQALRRRGPVLVIGDYNTVHRAIGPGARERSGRPGSLLTLAPHRSGRAGSAASGSSTDGFATRRRVPAGPGSQAMATAIPKACLASSAIRCRDVETGPNLGVLAVFPSPVPPAGAPFPPRGLVGSIPPLRRYYETLRLLAVHPPALRCLHPAVPSEHLRLRSVGRQVLRPRPRAW